jgi:hypothetical protein
MSDKLLNQINTDTITSGLASAINSALGSNLLLFHSVGVGFLLHATNTPPTPPPQKKP